VNTERCELDLGSGWGPGAGSNVRWPRGKYYNLVTTLSRSSQNHEL
jgi:hypothetical protein